MAKQEYKHFNPRMIIVEFFCGNKSLSKVAQKEGYECFTIDIDKKFNPDLCIDILNFKTEMLPKEFREIDLLWFSPLCTKYSHANRKGKWDLTYSNSLVLKSLELIKELKPKHWIIENPQTGTLKNQSFMKGIPFTDCSFCKYGMSYRKQTRLWNNANLKLETCNKDCMFMGGKKHINSVGNGRKEYAKFQRYSWDTKLKYHIPEKLILSILKQLNTEAVGIPPKPKGLGILPNFI
jgi:hypothetical protein